MSKNFVLIGAAGYVAPKHMKAIRDIGGNLLACIDPHDSVGILDSYFPNCRYFKEWERFDRYCNYYPVDYVVVCSPNYLHEAHSRWGLKLGADVICEKPLALTTQNLTNLTAVETETGNKITVILQLRLMALFNELKNNINNNQKVILNYITPRGNWYYWSWKGDESKSGGLATNIGIHLFDIITWIYGACRDISINKKTADTVDGIIYLEKANVKFHLSIAGKKPQRTIAIDGREIDFSNGFTELHTESYREILAGRGFGIADALPSIAICEEIRRYAVVG